MKPTVSRRSLLPTRATAMLGMLAAAMLVLVGLVAPATAASNDMSVKIHPIDTEVLAGQNITFEVQWQCGSTNVPVCADAQLEVALPLSEPDGLELAVGSFTQVGYGTPVVNYPAAVVGTGAAKRIVWKFPAQMAGSNSGTVSFTLNSRNWVTPDGTTITPVATFVSSAGTDTATSAPATVRAEAGLKVEKTKYAPSEDPYVNGDVTYLVRAGYPSQWNDANAFTPYANMCQAPGLWALSDLKVVDELPPGTVFRSATHGGVYDAASHTVTWDLGDSIALDAQGNPSCDGSTFGKDLLVTASFPEDVFAQDAQDHTLQTNNVSASASKWQRPDDVLRAADSASHYVLIGGDGDFTVQKGLSYAQSNAKDRQLWRGATINGGDWVRGYLHSFSVKGSGSDAGTWSLVDVLPCGWTSPGDVDSTDCANPAYDDISFGANGNLDELTVNWITNTGRTGVCTIPEGFTAGDNTTRTCAGVAAEESIPMSDGEWITKFWLDDNELKAGATGKLMLFGRVSLDIPLDNSQAVANGEYQPHFLTGGGVPPTPVAGVTPASQHPLWVTIENCTADNTVRWAGKRMTQNDTLVDSNSEGRCGYTRVVRDPVNVYTEKRMYNPETVQSGGDKNQQPLTKPGDLLRVEVMTQRDSWYSDYEADTQSTFTPTITEILPENLAFDPQDAARLVYLALEGDPERPESAVIAKLGEPRVTVTEIQLEGKPRTQIVVDFPNVPDGGGLRVVDPATGARDVLTVGFDVRVKENTPAKTYKNYVLVQAAEAAKGYLVCAAPSIYADPNPVNGLTSWNPLDFNNSVQGPDADTGCRADRNYTVVEAPGVSSRKEVQGAYDAEFIPAPGIGSTDGTGVATYRIPVMNTGNVNTRDVVTYDLLPRVGDLGVRPGADARGSEFDVHMTGPVTGTPSGATVQYSQAANPCRGELAGAGGGTMQSAPAGCVNDWTTAAPANWASVTGIRIDFGARVWLPGDTFTAEFPAVAGGGNLMGTAWNNVAVASNRASDGTPSLPSEAPKVGLQLTPDLSWSKVDGGDGTTLLAGSEWTLTPVVGAGERSPAGDWPLTVLDCVGSANCEVDRDPAAGKFLLSQIPWGTYDLVETKAPAGYVLATDPVRIVVGPGNLNESTWTYEFGAVRNFKPGVNVSWQKVDPQGARLEGSQWDLVAVDADGVAVPGQIATVVTDCIATSAEDCAGSDTDPVAGEFTIKNVAPGSYHLVETRAPAGFVKLAAPIAVVVTADQAVAIGDIENKQVAVPALPFTGGLGTLLFFVLGGLMLCVTVALLLRSVRTRRTL